MQIKEATLALIVRDGKLLLGVRPETAVIGGRTLNGPGGKLLPGETPLACMRREIEEETGLRARVTEDDHRATIVFHNGRASVWKVYVYLVIGIEGEPQATDELKPDGSWWYDLDTLGAVFRTRMLASDGAWMPKVLERERFTAHVYQNADATQLDRIMFRSWP